MYSVSGIFRSVANRYDLMNDLMSFGLHRYWKDCLVGLIHPKLAYHWDNVSRHVLYNAPSQKKLSQQKPSLCVVDLAGGTGDIAFRISELSNYLAFRNSDGFKYVCKDHEGYYPKITVIDPSEEMISKGKCKSEDKRINWVVGRAESIPLPDSSVDIITIGFGVRNFDNIKLGLSECHRILKPGGSLYILEFSNCDYHILSNLYSIYSNLLIPWIGNKVVGDAKSYQYLVDSIAAFPNKTDFSKIILDSGLGNVSYKSLAGGIVAIHCADRLSSNSFS